MFCRITPFGGWIQETTTVARATPSGGWLQETRVFTSGYPGIVMIWQL